MAGSDPRTGPKTDGKGSRGRLHWSWAAVLSDPVRLSVLEGLCELETANATELGACCHASDRTLRRHLEALEELGLVREQPGERDGVTPGRPPSRFSVDARARERIRALLAVIREPLVPTPAPARLPPPPR